MPVRRRKAKARPAEARAWVMTMMSGRDYFDELVDAGIVAKGENPPRELVEETWRRIGPDILNAMDDFHVGFRPPERPIWAEREFGPAEKRGEGRNSDRAKLPNASLFTC